MRNCHGWALEFSRTFATGLRTPKRGKTWKILFFLLLNVCKYFRCLSPREFSGGPKNTILGDVLQLLLPQSGPSLPGPLEQLKNRSPSWSISLAS